MTEYQQCSQCVLDTNDTKNISFSEDGVCNYCLSYAKLDKSFGSGEDREKHLIKKVAEIKKYGKNHEYDCLAGVSGGVDSTYLAYWAKEQGLRPLVVHFDNGWNSELAVKNIQSICEKLGFELNTLVIDWEEFKELQLAFLRASVIDIEMITDHAIRATLYKIARKHKIKYILSGFNYITEGIMPKGWTFDKLDWRNIKDIAEQYGKPNLLKTFPHMSVYTRLYYQLFMKLERVTILNYMDYNKDKVKELIIKELGWRDYGGKHYESQFTKFYQAYILPTKFGVDKRKAHLSTLICSGQMTKDQALEELKAPLYDESELKFEKEYVLKKLGLKEDEFEKIMSEKPRPHTSFASDQQIWERYFKLIKVVKKLNVFCRQK